MDRRRAERHEVHLPVQMEWGEGVTRDMSALGAYIESPAHDLPVGQTFNFSVTVGQTNSASWTLRCQGLVIRIDQKGDRIGIATAIDRFLEISPNQQAAASMGGFSFGH